MAVAIEEIKQIYKRYIEGSVHTLAAATSIASVENSTNEPSWREIIESYREFVPNASNDTWSKSYYCQHLERWDWSSFEQGSAIPCITLPKGIAQNDYDIDKIIPMILIIKKNN